MKKSKFVAVLVISAMLFTAMPSSASAEYGFWGLLGGAVVAGTAAIIVSGGTALPFIVGSAGYGAVTGGGIGIVADAFTGKEEDARDAVDTSLNILKLLSFFGL